MQRTVAASFAASMLLTAHAVGALPKEGESAPDWKIEDADGRVLETKATRGKPTLIVYEDKDSAKQNKELKTELAKLAKGDKYKSKIALAAVADVSSYDFWPVKGFVKDAIREESVKAGTPIYCDWSGKFRTTFGMKASESNVVLVGKSGKILFAAHGALTAESRAKLLELLRSEAQG